MMKRSSAVLSAFVAASAALITSGTATKAGETYTVLPLQAPVFKKYGTGTIAAISGTRLSGGLHDGPHHTPTSYELLTPPPNGYVIPPYPFSALGMNDAGILVGAYYPPKSKDTLMGGAVPPHTYKVFYPAAYDVGTQTLNVFDNLGGLQGHDCTGGVIVGVNNQGIAAGVLVCDSNTRQIPAIFNLASNQISLLLFDGIAPLAEADWINDNGLVLFGPYSDGHQHDGSIYGIYNINTGTAVQSPESPTGIDDNNNLYYNFYDGKGEIGVYDLNTKKKYTINNDYSIGAISASSDGKVLATDGEVPAHYYILTPDNRPPSLLQLAEMSDKVYDGNDAPLGYQFIEDTCSSSCNTQGLRVAAYLSADQSQLVFAFRGTDKAHWVAGLKDAVADFGFRDKRPNKELESFVSEAASFVQQVLDQHKGIPLKSVTLTGHSLGGALVQFISETTGLQAVVFGAPGGKALLNQLKSNPALASLAKKYHGIGGSDTNYRIYGDQLSLFGQQYRDPITLPHRLSNSEIEAHPIKYLLEPHDIDLMTYQIANNAQSNPEGDLGPTLGEQILDKTTTIIKQSDLIYLIGTAVSNAAEYKIFDPGRAADFVYSVNSGPLMNCVALPSMNGAGSWNVRAQAQDGTWSNYVNLADGGEQCYSAPQAAFDFMPTDADGNNIELPDALYFGIQYASTGDASATLTENKTITITAKHPHKRKGGIIHNGLRQ
jgi:hypothetical protein